MGLTYRVDHERRLVLAEGSGTVTDQDVFGYQFEVWSRPELAGFSELVDMTQVGHVVPPSNSRLKELATLAAGMDAPEAPSRFAIVASGGLSQVLGRMYQAYRELDRRSTKEVAVFDTREQALAWLGVSPDGRAEAAGP